MNFVTWIIFIIWLSFAENSPITDPVSPKQGIDATTNVTKYLAETFEKWKAHYYEPKGDPSWPLNKINRQYTHTHTHTFNQGTQTPVYNITMDFNLSPFPKFQIFFTPVNNPTEMDIFYELGSVSLKAYLANSDRYVASEINPLNVKIKISSYHPRNYITDIQNLDQIKFKPLNSDYQYNPNEETQVKQAITTYMSKSANELVNRPVLKGYLYTYLEGMIVIPSFTQFYLNKVIALAKYNFYHPGTSQKHHEMFYYYIDTISSAECTLSNVIITGSWSIHSISMDSSNLTKFFTIQFTNVQGTLQKFGACSRNKTSLELNFKADHVNAIADMKVGRMKMKFEDYLIIDAESNITLDANQSRSIVERIESAIESSISTSPRAETPPEGKITMHSIDFEKMFDLYFKFLTNLFSRIF